jgi:phosphatidylinositol glycan class U
MALRFPHRPLLLFVAQCLITTMFKPYPSVGDHALVLGLLPLLAPQLSQLTHGMLLTLSFLLLAALEPAMWHQWIRIESANANFYYSIGLLIGTWQTVLLVHLLLLSVRADREAKTTAASVEGASQQLNQPAPTFGSAPH